MGETFVPENLTKIFFRRLALKGQARKGSANRGSAYYL